MYTNRILKSTSTPWTPGACGKTYRPSHTSKHLVPCPNQLCPPSLLLSLTDELYFFQAHFDWENKEFNLTVDLSSDELSLSFATTLRKMAQMEYLFACLELVQGSLIGSSQTFSICPWPRQFSPQVLMAKQCQRITMLWLPMPPPPPRIWKVFFIYIYFSLCIDC